jgi:hypothetical protein
MLSRLVCWFRGHSWERFGKRHYRSHADAIPDWLYQCERCGKLETLGVLWLPSPWPDVPKEITEGIRRTPFSGVNNLTEMFTPIPIGNQPGEYVSIKMRPHRGKRLGRADGHAKAN